MKLSLNMVSVREAIGDLAVQLFDTVAAILQSPAIVFEEDFIVLRVIARQREVDRVGGHVKSASSHGNVAFQLKQSQLIGNRMLAELFCETRLHELPALPNRPDADDTQVTGFYQRFVDSRQQSAQHLRKLTTGVDENLLAQLVAVARSNRHFLAQSSVKGLLEACVDVLEHISSMFNAKVLLH